MFSVMVLTITTCNAEQSTCILRRKVIHQGLGFEGQRKISSW